LQERYNCKVGYSGHEKSGLAITYGAVALGATSIERHITLDRSMYGSDQPASMTVAGFEEMVGGIRNLEKALNGEKNKKILDIEIPLIQKLRSHIKSKN
jgi:N-acetylneuraminate synthase